MAMRRERLLEQLERLDWSRPLTARELSTQLEQIDHQLAQEVRDHFPGDRTFQDPEELLRAVLPHFWRERPRDRLSPWGRMNPDEVPERTREEHVDEPD